MDAEIQGLLAVALCRTIEMRRRKAFTLIELLVVISIIALLVAVLLPAVARAGRQAKAVACQARLRQWGIVFHTYAQDYGYARVWVRWPFNMRHYLGDCNDLFLCPMAAKRVPVPGPWGNKFQYGRTFAPWYLQEWPDGLRLFGGYGVNLANDYWDPDGICYRWWGTEAAEGKFKKEEKKYRKIPAANVPVLLDCVSWWAGGSGYDQPPPFEGALAEFSGISYSCVNRHDGGVNSLFLDQSVRKVGLKELWTLKWFPWTETHGPWTKAGGVQPEDWPPWMRRFKDY